MQAEEGAYVCPGCGEEIVVGVDPHAGRDQEYVEDCPVCCIPVLLRVRIERDGRHEISATAE